MYCLSYVTKAVLPKAASVLACVNAHASTLAAFGSVLACVNAL